MLKVKLKSCYPLILIGFVWIFWYILEKPYKNLYLYLLEKEKKRIVPFIINIENMIWYRWIENYLGLRFFIKKLFNLFV
jgi:hypothetical protein